MEHHRITVHRLIAFLPLILLGSCNATESNTAASPYPVYDSGRWADPIMNPDIHWIDDYKVIFRSVKDNDKRSRADGPFNLSIWEIGQSVSVYAIDVVPVQGPLGRFCYNSEGTIFYPLKEKDVQGNEQYKHGQMGHEKLFTRPKDAKTIFDSMNCRVLDVDTMMKERKGRSVHLLLTRHGYLDLGSMSGKESLENNPIVFYRADGSVIQLPVRRQELGLRYHYFPFKDAYLFEGVSKPDQPSDIANLWPASAQHMFWLYPSHGRIEPVILPASPWKDRKVPAFGLRGLVPLKEGFFVIHGEPKDPKDAGTVGGYLLRGEKLTKVVSGYLDSLTVSPDGCKVAFVHYPYADATLAADPAPIRLKAVDLCTERSTTSNKQ